MKITKNIQNTAIEVLINESEAIRRSADYIGQDFEKCVLEILQSEGRVVVTGIGKSAIIANKIVATLNSTGTPALFMHAADAIHGDLGMVQKHDVVICLSKSGNTPEIKVLVPLLKRTGSKLVAIVSNVDSYLAKQSDFVLNGTIDTEACPNNLAPTTSTTVHLALGDALAVSLLKARGFTSEDFAKYHPGGSLGKQLYLKIFDLSSENEVPKVSETTSMQDVILEISSKRLGATAVVDANDKLVGIVTDGDLRRMLQNGIKVENSTAGEVMSQNPLYVEKDDYAVKALHIMQSKDITQLLVVDDMKVVGMVHLHDLLKEGLV